jgi:hypothetical protein
MEDEVELSPEVSAYLRELLNGVEDLVSNSTVQRIELVVLWRNYGLQTGD